MNPVRDQQTPSADFVKYDLANILPDFLMSPECVTHIQDCIRLIEIGTEEQQQLNEVYDKFSNFVKSEMNEKLSHKTVHIKNGLSNKRRKVKKAYWSENLSVIWNAYVDAERQASHAYGWEKLNT